MLLQGAHGVIDQNPLRQRIQGERSGSLHRTDDEVLPQVNLLLSNVSQDLLRPQHLEPLGFRGSKLLAGLLDDVSDPLGVAVLLNVAHGRFPAQFGGGL